MPRTRTGVRIEDSFAAISTRTLGQATYDCDSDSGKTFSGPESHAEAKGTWHVLNAHRGAR